MKCFLKAADIIQSIEEKPIFPENMGVYVECSGVQNCHQTPLIEEINFCILGILKKILTATSVNTLTLLKTLYLHEVAHYFQHRTNNVFFQIAFFINDFKALKENILCVFTLCGGSRYRHA